MIVKRIISAITGGAILVSMSSVFAGCSMQEFFAKDKGSENSNDAGSASPVSDGTLTNGEWLAMVNDAFGMQVDESAENGELDAAKTWGVVGEDEVIDLNAPVDDKFVTTTLMRASGYVDTSASDQDVINAAIAHGVITDANSVVSDPAQAAQSLAAAQDAWSHQEFEERYDISLQDNVVDYTDDLDVTDYKINSDEVVLPSEYAESLEEDSVFILPKDGDGDGGAYKTIATIKNKDGTTTVKSVPADFTEVYQDVHVSGKFGVNYSEVEGVDGAEVSYGDAESIAYTSDDETAVPLAFRKNNDNIQQLGASAEGVTFTKKLGENFTVKATVKDITLNSDIDWSYKLFQGLKINKIYMAVDYTTEVVLESEDFNFHAETDELLLKKALAEPSLDIGKMAVYICPGISVNLRVKLSLDASCKLKVTVTTNNTKGFEMVGSDIRAINETSSTQDIVLSGKAGAYLNLTLALSLDYLVGEVDLLSITLKVGPTIEAEVKIHNESGDENDVICIDVDGYLTIQVKVEYLKKLMDLLNLPSSVTLVDLGKGTSPIEFHFHLENFERTPGDVCTVDGEEATEAPTEEETIPTGIFAIETSYISIDVGSSSTIKIKSLPTGYSASDIVWTSTDPSKVSVDGNGNVTAVSAGSVGITASTSDGKYTVSCAVNAKGNSNVSYSGSDIPAFGDIAA